MDQKAHHIQDASELYAVAILQGLAERHGIATTSDSAVKMKKFRDYAAARKLTSADFSTGTYAKYKTNVDTQIPVFFQRLARHLPGETLDFIDVEAAYRNLNKKGDFVLEISRSREISFSLKNYRNGAARPQVCSGTYNSFILNFLFEADGVGTWVDPKTGAKFRGAKTQRDAVLLANGFQAIVPLMAKLDALNEKIRKQFVNAPEFEFLDERVFDAARKRSGKAGAALAFAILQSISQHYVKARLLKMTGLDGDEESLIIDARRNVDSLTSPAFRRLVHGVGQASLNYAIEGQGIKFRFISKAQAELLTVTVPFTINKNGAWISGDPYVGKRAYGKEPYPLAYNQRGPRKSKELATSVNTYVDFEASGIFA